MYNNKNQKTMRTRIKNHVGCCFLMATTEVRVINTKTKKAVVTKVTKKAIFKPAYLTPSEREDEEHFRELLEIKKSRKYRLFKD